MLTTSLCDVFLHSFHALMPIKVILEEKPGGTTPALQLSDRSKAILTGRRSHEHLKVKNQLDWSSASEIVIPILLVVGTEVSLCLHTPRSLHDR